MPRRKRPVPQPVPAPVPTPVPAPAPAPIPASTPVPATEYFIPHEYLSKWPLHAPLAITVVDNTTDAGFQQAIADAVLALNAGPKGTMALRYQAGVPGSVDTPPGPFIYFLDWFCDPNMVTFNAQGQPESPTNTLPGVLVGNGVYAQSVDPGNPIPYGVTGLNGYWLGAVPGSIADDATAKHGLVMLELLNHFANEISSFDYPNYIGPQGTHWPANPPLTWDDWGQLDASYPQ